MADHDEGETEVKTAIGSCPTDQDQVIEIDEEVSEATTTKKQRKLTSPVWEHFIKMTDKDGNIIAKCNYCKKHLTGNSRGGTTHLKSHINRCPLYTKRQSGQSMLVLTKGVSQSSGKVQTFKFDQEKSRIDLAKMIIKHNYPFNMAEHEFFEIFCNGLQPMFKLVSRTTIRSDIIKVYEEEKKILYDYLDSLDCRITLTTDMWTAHHQNYAYGCLTAHFIDDQWKLKKKILSFKQVLYPHDAETLFKYVTEIALDWNIDKKLFAMVVDNASNNDSMIRMVRSWLLEKSLVPLNGDMFHVRCSAHILNLIVQDGLKEIIGVIHKIRESVRYLNRSPFGKQKFDNAIIHLKLQGIKRVPMDVSTRWNSTYLMLEASLSLKEAFCRLEQMDRNYKYNPSKEEWEIATIICKCLKVFYDATCNFSGTKYPTANIFFHDICEIQLELMRWETHENICVASMVRPMKVKFVKYWDECSLVLAIAVVLDPRFKMTLVEYYFDRIYGTEAQKYIQRVRTAIFDMFIEYESHYSLSLESYSSLGSEVSRSILNSNCEPTDDKLSEFDRYVQARTATMLIPKKSELDQYLEEPVFPRNQGFEFNILQWWKVNSAKLPTLGKMARDILAVPATTVASEAAFSVGGRVLDENRSCLQPDVVEALITANDWIESSKSNG